VVEGRVKTPRWGLEWVTSGSINHMDLHTPNNKLINAWFKHFWCRDKSWAYMDSQDSPRSRLGGSHHLPLIIFSVISHGAYIQMSFFPKTPKFPKFSKLEPGILQSHNFLFKSLIEMKSKEKL
jgi:hypothetical protein